MVLILILKMNYCSGIYKRIKSLSINIFMRGLVVLDRDGTINYDTGYFGRDNEWKEQLKIYPGVSSAIKIFNEKGFKVVVASNQAGVARGFFDEARVVEVNQELDRRLRQEGAIVDGWYFSPFVPSSYAKEKGIPLTSRYVFDTDTTRKPGTGMLEQAARDLEFELNEVDVFVFGDKVNDVQTGLNASGFGVLFDNGKNKKHVEETIKLSKDYNGRMYVVDGWTRFVQLVLKLR